MACPDFLQFHCVTSDHLDCAACSRDLILPLSAIAAFYRTTDNRVIVYPKREYFSPHRCIGEHRMIETTMTWPGLVAVLDGKLENVGDFEVLKD